MGTIIFQVDGPLLGYRASIRRAFDPKYKAFKHRVLLVAQTQGWQGRAISVPAWPVHLSVDVSWKNNPRIDWKNVYGAIEDALFEQDRYVIPGKRNDATWNTKEAEHAIVQIDF
jgi:phosphoglycolate phosphatase-like HAD superfamily hydrolase